MAWIVATLGVAMVFIAIGAWLNRAMWVNAVQGWRLYVVALAQMLVGAVCIAADTLFYGPTVFYIGWLMSLLGLLWVGMPLSFVRRIFGSASQKPHIAERLLYLFYLVAGLVLIGEVIRLY